MIPPGTAQQHCSSFYPLSLKPFKSAGQNPMNPGEGWHPLPLWCVRLGTGIPMSSVTHESCPLPCVPLVRHESCPLTWHMHFMHSSVGREACPRMRPMPSGKRGVLPKRRPDQVMEEVSSCLRMLDEVYRVFGLTYKAALSTRPDSYLGTLQQWDTAESALRAALDQTGKAWEVGADAEAATACVSSSRPPLVGLPSRCTSKKGQETAQTEAFCKAQ